VLARCAAFVLFGVQCYPGGMDVATQTPPVAATLPRKYRQHKRRPPALVPQEGKWGPLVRANMDRRTLASKRFDALVTQIRLDCGDSLSGDRGDDTSSDLSAVQLAMIESFAGCSVLLDALTTKALLGEEVDPFAFCTLSSTLTRIGSRLGLTRKARLVETPSLSGYLREREHGPDEQEGAE
jgi:hypothetical protein